MPSDYAILRLVELPGTGGGIFPQPPSGVCCGNSDDASPSDTLWASGYELYDRLSAPYQKFLDTLTATYTQPKFNASAKNNNFKLYSAPVAPPITSAKNFPPFNP